MSTDKLKTMDDYFNQFLLSMLNNGNAPLICELKLRWKEFCNTPILNNDTEDTKQSKGEDACLFDAVKINERLAELKKLAPFMYTQSEVDTIRREDALHYFREGYKYLRATNEKIVPYDELAEMTVVGAFENLIRKEANLNSKDTGKEDMIKVETGDKEFIQICFGNAISGTCFDYSVDQLKDILMKDMDIEQPTNDNAFVWDKNKVAEFAFFFKNMDTNNVSGAMDMFEQNHPSKQSAPPIVKDKEVLFTTEDGVEIKESDDIVLHHVSPNFNLSWSGSRYLAKQDRGGFKIFSTKEAAEEYILLNAPELSVNDVMEFYVPHEFVGNYYGIFRHDKLKEKVKQKLSK